MNIKEELLREHSKKQTLRIGAFVANNDSRFGELMQLFLSTDILLAQRASWAAYTCCRQYPELVFPYLELLIRNLEKPVHNAVKRHTVGILQHIDIPIELMGIATNACFKLLISKDEAIAVKANAMTVLEHIAQKEAGLAQEIKLVITEMMIHGKPAIVARGKRVLKELTGIG